MSRSSLTEWHRKVALDIAQAFPLTPAVRIRASGNHLASQNDEPEPTTADDSHLAQVAEPVESATEYAQRKARENDRRALEAQVMNADALRRAGWL